MKKSAKILSIILALVMILSAIPMAAFAADTDFVINGSGVLTAYNGAGGDVVIPDGVTAIGDGVFHGNTSITSVKFPSSVKTIGYASFRECTSLQTVTFSEGLETLGEKSFQLCNNIQTLELPSSLRTICQEALTFMNGIKNLVIPEGVTTIEFGALGSLCYLESISFPASATSIGFDLFWDCERLASVTVDPANPVYDSRDNCNAIIETATNTLVSGSISTVIPDSVTSIGPLSFAQMMGLESITIPDSVTSIGPAAFQYCYSLKSITLHDGITNVGENAFMLCDILKTVYYPCDDNVATIESFMSPHGTYTYTPLHDVVTFTDNGDGTHTGSCACGSFKTEKEAHNFVDGVCTFCGAKEGFKTIREILDTVPDFPTNEEDAWTNENGAKVYLTFEGIWQIVFPDMQSGVNNSVVKSGDNYYESYVPDTIYVMKDGVLDCIIVSRSVEGDLNGTYRPACKHPNAYTVPEKAVTCTEDGHSAYLYCPDCDEALEVYDVYVALNHAYAEDVDGKAATCTEDGLTDGKYCPDCDTWLVPQEVIPALNHKNAYNENGEAETCSSSGVTPGVYCPDCDTYISGHETIDPHPHSITDEYIDNEDGTHSQFCEECGEPIITKEHTFVDGVCVCGAKESLTILDVISTNKDFPTDIANAWLSENGSTLYKTATGSILFADAKGESTWNISLNCDVKADGDNYIFADFIFNMEDGVLKSVTMIDQYSSLKGTYAPHTHAYTDSYVDNGDGTHTGSCACGAVNPEKEEHTFVDGVCVCGATEPHIHIFDMAWTTNETAHWHSCFAEGCDITDYSTVENSYYGLHEWKDGKCTVCDYECKHQWRAATKADGEDAYCAPDCENNGWYKNICEVCGAVGEETYDIPAPGHVKIFVNIVEPTCTKGGYKEFICGECRYFGKCDIVDPLGHDLAWDGNAGKDGQHTLKCSRCDYTEAENCTFENGVCTVCGAKEAADVCEIAGVKELTEPRVGNYVTLEITTTKPVQKIQFVNENGGTITFDPTYAHTLSVVDKEDGTQVWTIELMVYHQTDVYSIHAKNAGTGWSDKTLEYAINDSYVYQTEVQSIEIPDGPANRIIAGRHDIVIKTGVDTAKVQLVLNGATATYTKDSTNASVTEEDGCLVWTINYNFGTTGEGLVYTVRTRAMPTSFADEGTFTVDVLR